MEPTSDAPSARLVAIGDDQRMTHVAIVGSLDLAGSQAIETSVAAHILSQRRPTIIELDGLAFIASLGISVLVGASRTIRARSLPFVLVAPRPEVEAVLRGARLHQIMHIVATRAEALAIVAAARAPSGDDTAT